MNNLVKKTIQYDYTLRKGDLIEMYCKLMANLGPLNVFNSKNISLHTDNGGYGANGLGSPLVGYISRQIMDVRSEKINSAEMSRGFVFSSKYSRRIYLEQIADNHLIVTIEGKEKSVDKIKTLLDSIYDVTGKRREEAERLVELLEK